jgi:hypothetical protein
MKTTGLMRYFYGSFVWSFLGLALAGFLGFQTGGVSLIWQFIFLAFVLSLLEVSISFDNAVVNATVLKEMTPLWQRRFMTWGILIAVFGMRLVFPILIVALSAWIGPWETLKMAAFEPARYAEIMTAVHAEVAAFGGTFLALVACKFFFDTEKEVHWLSWIERPLTKIGRFHSIETSLMLLFLWGFSKTLPPDKAYSVLVAGVCGVVTFLIVESIGEFLKVPDAKSTDIHKASLGMFLYLEVLDASFSFDGVIGAFAITNNLFLIMIGLGIGALFVRSLTIMMVEKGTLDAFVYLEHGAFWAVGALAAIMFTNVHFHIPEVVTGLVGVLLIGWSLWASRSAQRRAHA